MYLNEHIGRLYLLEPLGMNPVSVTHRYEDRASRIVFGAFSGTVDRLVFSRNEILVAYVFDRVTVGGGDLTIDVMLP